MTVPAHRNAVHDATADRLTPGTVQKEIRKGMSAPMRHCPRCAQHATMQNLGFVVEKADATLGSVTGTKLETYELRMTVTVRRRGTTQSLIRASAQFKPVPNAPARLIENTSIYQDFFAALAKSLFLDAQQVE